MIKAALLIARKDFLLNVRSVRFVICMLLCLLFVPFAIITGTDNFTRQLDIHAKLKIQTDSLMAHKHVWSNVRPITLRQPETLSIFSEGINNNIGMINKMLIGDYPVFPAMNGNSQGYYSNPLLHSFSFTDFSGILGIILSLLAFSFAYNSFTQEKEDGMLRMIFSEPVQRVSFIFGKLLGIFFTLAPVAIGCYLLATGYLIYRHIPLHAVELNGIFLLFLLSLSYLTLFIVAGTFISSLFHHSQSALIICFLCWIGIVFIIPPTGTYLAQMIVPLRDYKNLNDELNEIDNDFNRWQWAFQDSLQTALGLKECFPIFNNGWNDGGSDNWGISKKYAEFNRQANIVTNRMRIENADRKWTVQEKYLNELIRQKQIKQILTSLSPMQIYTDGVQNVCRTSSSFCLEYMAEERAYRQTMIDFFQKNHLFGSLSYFTTDKEEDLIDDEKFDRLIKEMDLYDQRLNDSIYHALEMRPLLDTSLMPQFRQTPPSVRRQWREASPVLGIFVLLSGLFLYLLMRSSARYDIR